jgi:hypothetical protein
MGSTALEHYQLGSAGISIASFEPLEAISEAVVGLSCLIGWLSMLALTLAMDIYCCEVPKYKSGGELYAYGSPCSKELVAHRQPINGTEGCGDSLGRGKLPSAASSGPRLLSTILPGLAHLRIQSVNRVFAPTLTPHSLTSARMLPVSMN